MRVLFYTIVILLASTGMALAEKCTGKWGGQTATSVMFSGGKKVRYCYKTQCWNAQFAGSTASRLKFTVGSATVSLRRAGSGYKATWQYKARKAFANLSCR
jgi:hypothetical protein